ncbi:MAG: hypothetical protein ACR2NZ_24645 [Rubripirellula sp.]
MMITSRIDLKYGLLIAVLLCMPGCGSDPAPSSLISATSESTSSSSVVTSDRLLLGISSFSATEREWESEPAVENPDIDTIKERLASINWQDEDQRPKVILSRSFDGSSDLLCVRRADSDRGELTIGVVVQIGDEVFEANHYNVESADLFAPVIEAFLQRDPSIKTIVEWDEIVE